MNPSPSVHTTSRTPACPYPGSSSPQPPSATQPRTAASPARLPLYLQGRTPTRVHTDGPALVVQVLHKAPKRYPLARIGRVIAGAGVEWHSQALSICQTEGIPIVFLNTRGEPTGYLQPMQAKPSRLDNVLEEMLERPDWTTHYNHWLRALRMHQIQTWNTRQAAAGHPTAENELKELVRQQVYQPQTRWQDYAQGSVQAGAITAYVLQALHRAGLKTCYWGADGTPLNLTQDLANYLALCLHLELHGLGASLHGDQHALLGVLHSFGTQVEAQMAHYLRRLHRRFKNQLEAWH